jgi:hypothetical protein
LGRYSFVAERQLVFHHDTITAHTPGALGAPPQGDLAVAAFTADGGVDGTSEITIFGNVTDPGVDIIAHEYGHALLWDYLARPRPSGDGLNAAFAFQALSAFSPGAKVDSRVTREYPEFAPLLGEYVQNPSVFGGYSSQTFGEWFAQASYYYLYEKPVPPRTAAFLRRMEALR